ncbi:MAG TPA: ABC transporter permease [Gemmatimonadales bacterium]|jgi:ABC-2 type transport system permease protein
MTANQVTARQTPMERIGVADNRIAPRTFQALLGRDIRVLRREIGGFLIRLVMQPLLFVFVFSYVLPKIGGSFQASAGSDVTFATILVPGLLAVTVNFQGLQAVALPLVGEFSWSKEIEDRVLAPVRVWVIGFEKIFSGMLQSVIAAAIVLPITYFIHAEGQAPHLQPNWALFVGILVLSSFLTSATGLLLGTIVNPNKISLLFGVVLVPVTFLGCVYYPWAALYPIPWLQALVCLNPLVYISEGFRWALTPQVGYMPPWAIMVALIVGTAALTLLSLRTFVHRVVTI